MRQVLILGVLCTALALSSGKEEKKKSDYGTVIGIDLGTTYSWLIKIHLFILCVSKKKPKHIFIYLGLFNLGNFVLALSTWTNM